MPSTQTYIELFERLRSVHLHVDARRCLAVRNRNTTCNRCANACPSGCITVTTRTSANEPREPDGAKPAENGRVRGDRNACDRPRTLHRLRNMRRRLPDRGHRPAQTRRPIARTPSRCRAAGHGRHRRVRLRAAHRAGARQIRPGYRGARAMRRAHRCEPPGADGLRRSLDHKVDLRKL